MAEPTLAERSLAAGRILYEYENDNPRERWCGDTYVVVTAYPVLDTSEEAYADFRRLWYLHEHNLYRKWVPWGDLQKFAQNLARKDALLGEDFDTHLGGLNTPLPKPGAGAGPGPDPRRASLRDLMCVDFGPRPRALSRTFVRDAYCMSTEWMVYNDIAVIGRTRRKYYSVRLQSS